MPSRNATCTTDSDEHALLDKKEVSALFGCSVRHIYRLVETGQMPAPVRLGSLPRWSKKALVRWIEAGCPAQAEWKAGVAHV